MPEISVIMPTWNRRALLLAAVASVRAQTFPDWELIVVDDGSTDGSADEVTALADGRIRVLRESRSADVAGLRNTGAAEARGAWVAFLDSDDLWEPAKLERQRAALLAAAARWSCTGYQLIDDAERPVPFRARAAPVRSGPILRELLTMAANVTICTVMVERGLFFELGGFHSGSGREDFDFLLRLAARAPVASLPDTLVKVRDHPDRTTAALPSPHEASLRPFERFLEREHDPELRRLARRHGARLLLDGARYEIARGQTAPAYRLLLRSLRYGPGLLSWSRTLASLLLRMVGRRR